MSCRKKVIETIETQCGKMFDNIVVWSDGMGAQFRSKFIFQLLAGNLFPDKSLSWCYNERHHGKGPMDGVGGTIKNVIFRKVKSGHAVVYTPNQFADVTLKFVPSITTVYLPCTEEITEPGNIDQSPAIAATLSIHKFERYINERGECSISFYKTAVDQEPFHTQWYCKTGIVCSHDESNKSDNECSKCGEYYQKDGSEWLQCPVCKKWFHETCFYE